MKEVLWDFKAFRRWLCLLGAWVFCAFIEVHGQDGPAGVGAADGRSSLSIWLDANGVQQEPGSPVIVWQDQSGYRNHARVLSESDDCCAPTLSYDELNGNQQVEFNGLDSYLGVSDNHTLRSDSLSLFVVGNITAESGDWGGFVMKNTSGEWESGFGIVRDWGRKSLIGYVDNAAKHSQQFDFDYGRNFVSTLVYDRSQIRLYRNDQAMPPYDLDIAIQETRSDFWIGWTAGYLAGDISEVILYQKAVNQVERILIHNYLSAKYGLELSEYDLYHFDDSSHGDYDQHVAGIGRLGDADNLVAQGSGVLSIGNPRDLESGEFLIWGSKSRETTESPSRLPDEVQALMDVEWRFSEVSMQGTPADVGMVDIVFDLAERGHPVSEDLVLLIDQDGDGSFTNDDILSGAIELEQDRFQFADVLNLVDGARLALGTTNIRRSPLAYSPKPVEPVVFNSMEAGAEEELDSYSTVIAILLILSSILALSLVWILYKYVKVRRERDELLLRLENWPVAASVTPEATGVQLDQERIHEKIKNKLNITDWRILNMLCEDPLISNKELAEHVSLSVEGTSSSLRKMYRLFEIKGTSNKKMVLVKEAMLASLPEN